MAIGFGQLLPGFPDLLFEMGQARLEHQHEDDTAGRQSHGGDRDDC